jgi:hypothetical protein
METASRQSSRTLRLLGVMALGWGTALSAASTHALAQQADGVGQSYGNPQLQKELDYGTGKQDGGSIFNTANPIELMNKLRKSSAMDDATSPSDAVDAALNGLDASSAPPLKTGSPQVKGP